MTAPWLEPPFTKFFRYWHTLYQECAGLPPRSLFNPMKLGASLAESQLLEREGSEVVVRLAGTAVEAITKNIIKPGTPLREHYSPEDYQNLVTALTEINEKECCLFARTERIIRNTYSIERKFLVLPFAPSEAGVYHYILFEAELGQNSVIDHDAKYPAKLLEHQTFFPDQDQ